MLVECMKIPLQVFLFWQNENFRTNAAFEKPCVKLSLQIVSEVSVRSFFRKAQHPNHV